MTKSGSRNMIQILPLRTPNGRSFHFNFGPHSVLYVRYYNVYCGSDHTDIDNAIVVAVRASSVLPTPLQLPASKAAKSTKALTLWLLLNLYRRKFPSRHLPR